MYWREKYGSALQGSDGRRPFSEPRTAQAESDAAAKALGKGKNGAGKSVAPAAKTGGADKDVAKAAPKPAVKLSQKEKRELDGMLEAIDTAEQALAALDAQLADPTLYAERAGEVRGITEKQQAASANVEAMMARWDELERRRAAAEG